MLPRPDPVNVYTFLEENTVRRLFELLLETAKEMPEFQNKLPPDCSFVFDFETLLFRKNSAADLDRLKNANNLSKALRERTLSLVTNLVYTRLENPETPIPDDCRLLFASCFNPSHWVAITADLNQLDKAAVLTLAQEMEESHAANKLQLNSRSEVEKKKLLLNHIKNAIIKKYDFNEKPNQLLALFKSIDMHFYDSRDPDTPYPNLYYDSARLQLDEHIHLQNSPCSYQQGNTCGDHSVFNVFFKGLLNQEIFINEEGSVTSSDLRALSQRLHVLATEELNIQVALAFGEMDHHEEKIDAEAEKLRAEAFLKRQQLEEALANIKELVQTIKPDLEILLRQINHYNALMGFEGKPAIEEDKNDLTAPTLRKIQSLEELLETLKSSNEEIILPKVVKILEEIAAEPRPGKPLYDISLLQEYFQLDKQILHISLIADVLIKNKIDKMAAEQGEKIIGKALAHLQKQMDLIKNQELTPDLKIIVLQRLLEEIHQLKTTGISTLSSSDVKKLLDNQPIKQTEAVIKAAQELIKFSATVPEKVAETNVYFKEKVTYLVLDKIELFLQNEIELSYKINNIRAILHELDISSYAPNLEETIECLASLVEDVILNPKNTYKEKICKEFNIDPQVNSPRIMAQLLIDRQMETIVLKECQDVLENTGFLADLQINIITQHVVDAPILQAVLEKISEKLSLLQENRESDFSREEIRAFLEKLHLPPEKEEAVMNAASELLALVATAAFTQNQKNDYLNAMKAAVVLKEVQTLLRTQIVNKQQTCNPFFLFMTWLKSRKNTNPAPGPAPANSTNNKALR